MNSLYLKQTMENVLYIAGAAVGAIDYDRDAFEMIIYEVFCSFPLFACSFHFFVAHILVVLFCLCMCTHIIHPPTSQMIFYALLNDITFFASRSLL